MRENIFDLTNIRTEISFKTFEQLRSILSFCYKNNLKKINIPCKNNLKKDFLLKSIRISREEFPNIDIVPHFSIFHEYNKNRLNTLNSFIKFLYLVEKLGCKQVLLVSGSQKRATLDASTSLCFLKENSLINKGDLSIGVAFNPYLPSFLFEEEIIKLKKKLKSKLVKSIWFQFGTDFRLLESRMEILIKILSIEEIGNSNSAKINLFGSILIPSKQFLARFKYRPWKGVYCSHDFLESVDFAKNSVIQLLKAYKKYNIYPLIETDISTENKLNSLKNILEL